MGESIKKFINLFLIGVLAFLPIFLIVQIVLFLKSFMYDGYTMVYGYSESAFLTIVLFVFSFMTFTYIGYRVKTGKSSIIALIDAVIHRIPFLNTIYRVTKKIVNIFSGSDEQMVLDVVYTEYPKEGVWVPAYVTNKEKDMYVLFIPTSPNPTSGFTVIVHESQVVNSAMSIEEATSFIVSVGVDFNHMQELSKLGKPK